MLKRKQILLPDWLDDYIKEISSAYNVSYSEVVRVMLSFSFGQVAAKLYPQYEFSIDVDRMIASSREHNNGEVNVEDNRKLRADIYYEAKKIIDDHIKTLKKINNSSKN